MLGYRCRLKRRGSKTWTPVRVVQIPSSMCEELKSLVPLNKHKGKSYEINDPRYGIDVNLLFDSRQQGQGRYKAQRDEKSKLTGEELEYLIYPLDVLKPETPEQAKKEWKN